MLMILEGKSNNDIDNVHNDGIKLTLNWENGGASELTRNNITQNGQTP